MINQVSYFFIIYLYIYIYKPVYIDLLEDLFFVYNKHIKKRKFENLEILEIDSHKDIKKISDMNQGKFTVFEKLNNLFYFIIFRR